MDSFEFAQIPIAILIGFGLSEILSGWGHKLRQRSTIPFSGLELVSSTFVLVFAIRYMWAQWALRSLEWDFVAYFLTLLPALVIALAAHLLRGDFDVPSDATKTSQYERNSRPLCLLMLVFVITITLRNAYVSTLIGGIPDVDSIDIAMLLVSLATMIGVFSWLAVTRQPRHHWIGWTIAWTALSALMICFLPNLDVA